MLILYHGDLNRSHKDAILPFSTTIAKYIKHHCHGEKRTNIEDVIYVYITHLRPNWSLKYLQLNQEWIQTFLSGETFKFS